MIFLNLACGPRKCSVSLSPNQTLAYALEKFCESFKLNVGEYALRHRNVQLDLSLEFRLSGLPNRANLDVCKKSEGSKGKEGLVKVALRVDGSRVVLEVPNTSTLWELLQKAESEKGLNLLSASGPGSKYLQPCMRYMSSVFCSNADLRRTTLSALGIRCQSVLFDFFREPTEVEVGEFLERDRAEQERDRAERERREAERERERAEQERRKVERERVQAEQDRVRAEQDRVRAEQDRMRAEQDRVRAEQERQKSEERSARAPSESQEMCQPRVKEQKQFASNESEITPPANEESKSNRSEDRILPAHLEGGGITDPIMSGFHKYIRDTEALKQGRLSPPPTTVDRDVKVFFPSEHQKAELLPDLPPDFFEPSAEEILSTFKRREDPEQLVLKTKAMRERSAAHFDRCLIRVRLPDGMQIQGTFHPQEKTEDVVEFVRSQLSEPNQKIDFYLYTSPPRAELKKETTLLKQTLTPASLLLLGIRPGQQMTAPILKPERLQELLPLYKKTVSEDAKFSSEKSTPASKNTAPTQQKNPTKARKSRPVKAAPKWFLAGKKR
ncbi:tether containing UBX domain for GLUT4-like [Schistocerca gregaria]|uniref:tether containing UBX domain for GLUT4-like n=1 Tax=Schistocerca gregaria TaxID=7010 RepID=UPI00211EE980|nr:tether containing UBX domain for GLUT4-like [Schistocerca gregaria]